MTSIVSARDVGTAVRDARKATGMTQTELADALCQAGLTLRQPQVSQIEAGSRELQYREALVLRAVIGFDAEHADTRAFREAAAFRRIRDAIEEVG